MLHLKKRVLLLAGTTVIGLAACGTAIESIGTTRSPDEAATSTAGSTTPATAAPTTSLLPDQPSTTLEAVTAAVPVTEPPATEPPTTLAPVTYVVSKVVDGDTVDIAAGDGNSFPVRLIGIDAPELGDCEATLATETMTNLAAGKTVTLTLGGDGEDTDKYGRLLRYVDADGSDLGLTMIQMGLAQARYDSRDGYGRHDREDEYVAADQASANYACPVTTTIPPTTAAPLPKPTTPKPMVTAKPVSPPSSRCDPNYTGCVPIDSDVDCAGGKGNGPSYVAGPVRVIGVDIYDLDRDGDGIACE